MRGERQVVFLDGTEHSGPGIAHRAEGREKDLRKATMKIGGDTVTWDRRDENNTIYGTAFKCN